MIHEADESLLAFFNDADFGYKSPEFSFDVPSQEWRGKLGAGPVVNFFLYHVAEMVDSRVASYREVRDANGRVSERSAPVRRYELGYLVSAWAANVTEEHRLLGDVLRRLADWETLPPQYRKGSLAVAELPIPMFVGTPVEGVSPSSRWDIWGTLGGMAKSSFDLVLSVPLIPSADTAIAPPAEARRFGFGLAGTEQQESVVSERKDSEAGDRNTAVHQAEAEEEARRTGRPAPPPSPASPPRRGRVVEGKST